MTYERVQMEYILVGRRGQSKRNQNHTSAVSVLNSCCTLKTFKRKCFECTTGIHSFFMYWAYDFIDENPSAF